jgi:hypothetical protein
VFDHARGRYHFQKGVRFLFNPEHQFDSDYRTVVQKFTKEGAGDVVMEFGSDVVTEGPSADPSQMTQELCDDSKGGYAVIVNLPYLLLAMSKAGRKGLYNWKF